MVFCSESGDDEYEEEIMSGEDDEAEEAITNDKDEVQLDSPCSSNANRKSECNDHSSMSGNAYCVRNCMM